MGGLAAFTPWMLSILRIVTGLIYLAHGSSKLLGFPTPGEGMPAHPPILSLMGVGGVLELVGGALIVLGLFTRPTAFVLSGQMAVAYWMFHAPQSPFPMLNMGDAAILYCFVFLYLVFAGPGPISLDAMMGGRRPRRR
ncbi:MAG TPA: DoxX family protein [Phenylobacterium sp.]